jgi:cysteine desulfurase
VTRIYLDHHATTPVDPAVLDAMLPYFTERFGNPSSKHHGFGQEAANAVEEARAQVAELIGADAKEIVFTSGATESDNLAIRGLVTEGHVVTTAIEHAAVLEPLRTLERRGVAVTAVPVDASGVVDVQRIADALRPETALVSVMAANNELGTIQPVAEIGALCRARGVAFHSDAVQALGRFRVDADAWGADLLSLSAHKVYGPKGVGALYVRRERRPRLRLAPQAEGGGQERGVRSGTLNVPGIVGFGRAAVLAREALASGEPARVRALRDRLLEGLRARIVGIEVNGSVTQRLDGNLHVSIEGVEAETLILSMGGGIAISSGAACAEAGGKGSHVLRAIGLSDMRIYGAVRFGVGRYNNGAEIDSAVETIAAAVASARARAPMAAGRRTQSEGQ